LTITAFQTTTTTGLITRFHSRRFQRPQLPERIPQTARYAVLRDESWWRPMVPMSVRGRRAPLPVMRQRHRASWALWAIDTFA
jgi:hypothetical protein